MRSFDDVKRWFAEYPGPSWTALILSSLLLLWLIFLIFSSGGSFLFILILAAIGIGIYHNQKDELPPLWIVISLICIPLFMWGFWVINPEWYTEWRNSRAFLWMIITMVVLAALSSHKSAPLASTARFALGALMITAIIMGAFGKAAEVVARNKATSAGSITTTTIVAATRVEPKDGKAIYRKAFARPGQPVVGVIPGNWTLCGIHKESEVDKDTIKFEGRKKLQFFFLREGFEKSEVELWIHPDSEKGPCDDL